MIGQSPSAYCAISDGKTVFPSAMQNTLNMVAIIKLSLKNLRANGTVPSSLSSMQADGAQLMKENKIMSS